MFITAFKTTGLAILEIFILGALGFWLVKRQTLSDEGLNGLSKIVLDVTLPLFVFTQFVRNFSFSLYPNWWIFPLLSISLTCMGFAVGSFFAWSAKSTDEKMQFLSLIGFQNSGYLPLPLIAALLAPKEASQMFIYTFLFLIGFNLMMFSVGVYMLASNQGKRLELGNFLNPPVVATIIGLLLVFFGAQNSIPNWIYHPLKMTGDCTIPLAIFVVGGGLATISFKKKFNHRAIFFVLLSKLIIMPALVLLILSRAGIPSMIGMLLLIQAAVPSATTLSVILTTYRKQDHIVNQSIFLGHVFSIVTIPVFLSLFYMLK
jgi:predicted permease